MRQNLLALGFLLTSAWTFAQANTEIYLFDLELDHGSPILSNPKNISNNEGYDNQPSFLDDHTVLFSSTRDGQTDAGAGECAGMSGKGEMRTMRSVRLENSSRSRR